MKPSENGAVTIYSDIPYNVLGKYLPINMKNEYFEELGEIVGYYNTYKKGSEFSVEGTNGDYVGSDVRFKKIKSLIDKEARFLFAHTPDFWVNRSMGNTQQEKDQNSLLNDFVMKVLHRNGIGGKLVRAAKDCFIGKRVACMLNFDESGIQIVFLRAYEFLYEFGNGNELSKIVAFYTIRESSNRVDKRIKKKAYIMENGRCYVEESIFDGVGNLLEETVPYRATEFDHIPAVVILNDGLTNDNKGESEIAMEEGFEGLYSKLANSDIDAERKNMNTVTYAIDASAESTESLSRAPGSFWDIQSNEISSEARKAVLGQLESSMNYSAPLKTTLDRINDHMHDLVEVPDINSEKLQGVITSGKTMEALYWGLLVRCDEKMLAWKPALEYIVRCIIEGGRLYPDSARVYVNEPIPEVEMVIEVVNNYPIMEDDKEEKAMDIAEVSAQVMSRKAYMKKWRGLTDEECDLELKQILMEKQLLEDSYIPTEREDEPVATEDEA